LGKLPDKVRIDSGKVQAGSANYFGVFEKRD